MGVGNIEYAVDGVQLDNPPYWRLLDAKPVGSNVSRRSSNLYIPDRDGTVGNYDEPYDVTTIGLYFDCVAANGRSITDSYEALMALLSKRRGPLVLTRTQFGQTVSANAKIVNTSNTALIATQDSMQFVVVLQIPAAFYRDITDQTWSQIQPTTGVAYRVTIFDNTMSDIRDAKIKLTGPFTLPVVRDMGSGGEFSVGTIASGRQVIVDTDTGYAYEAASTSSWALTGNDVTAQLRSSGPSSARRVLSLSPVMQGTDPFDRRVLVRVTSSGITSASKIEIQGRKVFA